MNERRKSNVHYIPKEADRRKVHGVVDGLIARTIQDTLGTRKAAEYLRRVEWPIERTLHLLVGRCRSDICSRCNRPAEINARKSYMATAMKDACQSARDAMY